MDGGRFDDLARALASGRSRRGLLKGLGAAALGAVGLRAGEAEAAARCRAIGEVCGVDGQCCTRHCSPKDRTGRRHCACASDAQCPTSSNPCQRAVCVAGACAAANRDGIGCDDGDACTVGDVCRDGQCAPGTAVVCQPLSDCHLAGTCDPSTGQCSNPAKNDGSACDDGDACTQTDVCQNGACVGGSPILCAALDDCHVAGSCDSASGVCSNPAKADGSACGSGQQCCQGVCCPHAGDLCLAAGCCAPDAAATTCAGKCGTVANNCGQMIDCTTRCAGCCDGGVCEPGTTDEACGGGGHACVACSNGDPVCGGHCGPTYRLCSYAGSHTACGHETCDNGTVTYVGACDGAGACQPGASFSCAPYQCNATGTACLGDCASDDDCVSGYYCGGIQCEPGQGNGAACDHGRQCASGNCVDGVCCASASCGACESCAAGNGTCATICGSGQTCCNGVCKVQGGYPCSGDSVCCLDDGYACGGGFCCVQLCGPFSPPGTVCCSAGNIG